jgi:arabinan endo-1,5-alpha-L-arabinosidase
VCDNRAYIMEALTGGVLPRILAAAALSAGALIAQSASAEVFTLSGDVSPVHDPTMIREGETWYAFATNRFQGKDVPMFCSPDLRQWKFCGHVFDGVPKWAQERVPGTRGVWAPDISRTRGEFRLYYSVSTFGSNHSVIGLAVNKTLDPASPDYKWVDKGEVFASTKTDDFNAIDPQIAGDESGGQWMSFGSFWSGIKMRRIDPETGKLSSADTTLYSLASRPRTAEIKAEIEAPAITRRGKYYYLFVSHDRCCRGAQSTYKIVVGRSEKITGPYVDRAGKPMMEGGGALLMEGNERWRGPGGQSVIRDARGDYLVFHAYDGMTGRPFLQVASIAWEDDWPRVASLPAN